MHIKQITVFLENTRGSLARVTRILSKHGVGLIAISLADTDPAGVMRCIVSDTDKGLKALRESGYVAHLSDVLAVSVPERLGGLADVLTLLNAANLSLEYLYSSGHHIDGNALIIFRATDNARAERSLMNCGVKLLTEEEVRAL